MRAEEAKVWPTWPWRKWAFALVPAAGLLELVAHVGQTFAVAPERDWLRARDYVAAQVKPEDLVAFAPRWADPLGREHFGPQLASIEREARSDESRFPRAYEVSLRGAHVPALRGWRSAAVQRFGSVTVTTWENPAPAIPLDDLVSHVNPQQLHVSLVQGERETDCAFVRGPTMSGGLGANPALPSERFECPAGPPVAMSVIADLDYYPRRCIYAPPSGGNAVLRLRFAGVRMGRALRGHHAMTAESERSRARPPVTMTIRVGGTELGHVVHHDGESWAAFELGTESLAGSQAEVTLDIAPVGGDRRYCFEMTTR